MNWTRYNLGPFNSGTYTPGVSDISDITQAENALVTTDEAHNYLVNQNVQFFIPTQWGMRQLNGLKGTVLTVPSSTTFTVSINTTLFDAFVTPVPPSYVVIDNAQVCAIGENNFGSQAVNGVLTTPQTVPGAFINSYP